MRGIHRSLVNSLHNGPVMQKMSPYDDIIMTLGVNSTLSHYIMHAQHVNFITFVTPTPAYYAGYQEIHINVMNLSQWCVQLQLSRHLLMVFLLWIIIIIACNCATIKFAYIGPFMHNFFRLPCTAKIVMTIKCHENTFCVIVAENLLTHLTPRIC